MGDPISDLLVPSPRGLDKSCLFGGNRAFSRLHEDVGDVHTADFKSS
jgi:hypothetical protein